MTAKAEGTGSVFGIIELRKHKNTLSIVTQEIVAEMDTSALMRAYKRTGLRPATNPVTLLKILLYANMEGIYSSHAIAFSCQRDINFIWLLDGVKFFFWL